MESLAGHADHSWVERLNADPQHKTYQPNQSSRQVKSGHYVPVSPTPLPKPYLVSFSPEMAAELGLSEADCRDDRFKLFFSGYQQALENPAGEPAFRSWATPYALAIYGQDMYHNCPFGNGNGYGDGRAVSIGEVAMPNNKRWEFQLKGGGRTPFCRGGDGRAVLRSSVREFLVSEAMYHLGVSTTRALSLVATKDLMIARPWFSDNLRRSHDPDVMIHNKAAITTRVAPSFLRVGHLQLFERRVRRSDPESLPAKMSELCLLIEHAIFREYPHINEEFRIPNVDLPEKKILTESSSVKEMKEFLTHQAIDFQGCFEKSDLWNKIKPFPNPTIITPPELLYGPLQPRALRMLHEASDNFATLMANWQRVGYCQGNFNSDNCLVGGRTMDYGPFGFMELYDPKWCMWTGGAPHFSWANQPNAGIKNFIGLASAVRPALDDEGAKEISEIIKRHYENTTNKVNSMWCQKLGLKEIDQDSKAILSNILELMEQSSTDYTIFWRQLPTLVDKYFTNQNLQEINENDWIEPLTDSFYTPPCRQSQWSTVLQKWMKSVQTQQAGKDPKEISASMRSVSPKYVPREWMLVEAYTAAEKDDFAPLEELRKLFLHPYEEQSEEMEKKYYRKPPLETFTAKGVGVGGKAFMT